MEKLNLNLRKVINASGKMTILGVSKVSDAVLEAQKEAGQTFYVMEELFDATRDHLTSVLKCEDAYVTSSASAGIVLSVLSVIGRGCQKHLYDPYDAALAPKREIIIPKGHNVNYGVPVEVMIKQAGGIVVEAGYANGCSMADIERAATERTAGILYVKSHHCVQKSMLSLDDAVTVARELDLPLIIDAAAEEDVFKYTALGADIVIYSGAKAFEGPSSGLLIGKKPYIGWARMHASGIGRSMKIGKDNILGLTAAINQYVKLGSESGASQNQRLQPFIEKLNLIEGVAAKKVQDAAGRDIYRASVTVQDAASVADALKAGNPAIYTRDYQVNHGIIEFDIRAVDEAEMAQIVERLKEVLA